MSKFLREAGFFCIFALVLFSATIRYRYGVSDDYYLAWTEGPIGAHPHVIVALFFNGRPLNAAWLASTYPFLDSVSGLWSARLIVIAAIGLSATLLFRFLRDALGISMIAAFSVTTAIISLPGFASFAAWYSAACCAFGFLLAMLAGTIAHPYVVEIQNSRTIARSMVPGVFLAITLQASAMLMYHPTGTAYGLFPLLVLLFAQDQDLKSRIQIGMIHILILGAGIVIFYLIIKLFITGVLMPIYLDEPPQFHNFAVNVSLQKNLAALFQIESTGAALWFVDGRRGVVIAVRALVVAGFTTHIFLCWRQRDRSKPMAEFLVHLFVYAGLVASLVIIVPNLVNLFAYAYNSYTRHTTVFSAAIILVCFRFLMDIMNTLKLDAKMRARVSVGMLLVIAVLGTTITYTKLERALNAQATDWTQALKATSALKPKARISDLNIGVQFPAFEYKRWGIGAKTMAIPTHAFLLVFAAFAQNGFLAENYRQELKVEYVGLDDDHQMIRFPTRFGTVVRMEFASLPATIEPANFDEMLDFR